MDSKDHWDTVCRPAAIKVAKPQLGKSGTKDELVNR
jgi:hypothetical protein